MSKPRPTPETDRMRSLDNGDSSVVLDFAESLERARDEARETAALVPELVEALEDFCAVNSHCGVGGLGLDEYKAANAKARAAIAKASQAPPLPDPLAVAVKCMEAVPWEELDAAWNAAPVTNSPKRSLANAVNAIRARIIQAAKGYRP